MKLSSDLGAFYQYDINIRFDEFDRRSAEDIGNLTIMSQLGQQVKLKQIASIYEGTGPNMMERYGRIPSITLQGHIEGRSIGDFTRAISIPSWFYSPYRLP